MNAIPPIPRFHAGVPVACPVCGCDRVELDEVLHGERLELGECAHCHYRWTRAMPSRPVRVTRPLAPRVAASSAVREAPAAA